MHRHPRVALAPATFAERSSKYDALVVSDPDHTHLKAVGTEYQSRLDLALAVDGFLLGQPN